jgi:hypothetical protein
LVARVAGVVVSEGVERRASAALSIDRAVRNGAVAKEACQPVPMGRKTVHYSFKYLKINMFL